MDLDALERRLLDLDGTFDPVARLLGRDVPAAGLTAVGVARLRQVRIAVGTVLAENVPGDLLDAGAWRGGLSLYLRALLADGGVRDRRVLVADSFAGYPPGSSLDGQFAVPLDQVQDAFRAQGLLDSQTVFLRGWFQDTLTSPGPLALLVVDATLYQSTMDVLQAAHDRVSPGGYVLVMDYGASSGVRRAVDEYRRRAWVGDPLRDIDGIGVYWRRGETQTPHEPPAWPLLPPQTVAGPLMTVIMPVHTRTRYLEQSLGSVLAQDPGPERLEIMVAQDPGGVDMEPLVRRIGGERVRFVAHPGHTGQWPGVNLALRHARGRWIHLLHDDDYVLDGFYAAMAAAAEAVPETVGVLCCGSRVVGEDGATLVTLPAFRAGAGVLDGWVERMAEANPVNLPAVMVRRSVYETVGVYDEDLDCADWAFHLRAAARWAWWYEPACLACYRRAEGSISAQTVRSGAVASDLRRCIQRSATWLPRPLVEGPLSRTRARHAQQFLGWAVQALQDGRTGAAALCVQEALALQPRWGQ